MFLMSSRVIRIVIKLIVNGVSDYGNGQNRFYKIIKTSRDGLLVISILILGPDSKLQMLTFH